MGVADVCGNAAASIDLKLAAKRALHMATSPPDLGKADQVPRSPRLISLDTFRGIVMVLMASDGIKLTEVARNFAENRVWQFFARQSDHVRWQGCTLWDLIMPAFIFMVGVSLPYSVASRRKRGQGTARLFAHAVWRSLVLV